MKIRWADQEDPDNQVPRYRQMQIRQIKNHAKMQQKSLVDWLGDHRGWEELSQELKKPWKPVPTTKTDPRRQGQQLGAMRIKHQEGMKQARQLARQAAKRAQREASDPRREQQLAEALTQWLDEHHLWDRNLFHRRNDQKAERRLRQKRRQTQVREWLQSHQSWNEDLAPGFIVNIYH